MSYKDNAIKKLQNTPLTDWKRAPLPSNTFRGNAKKADVQIISKAAKMSINKYNSPEEIKEYDDQLTRGLGDYFINYTEANYQNGLHVISSDTDIESEPLHIKYILNNEEQIIESNFFDILPSNTMTIILEYQSDGDNGLHHGISRFHARAGSRLNVIRLQNINRTSHFFDTMYFQVDEGAEVKLYDCQLGANYNAVSVQADLKSRHSSFEVYSAYLGFDNDRLDLSYTAKHFGSPTTSKILAKGALDGNAKKTFRGTLDFQHGSSQSVGQEDEFVLLLNPAAHSDSLPALMCQEDDVIGEHAASIGRIDADQLFYMMSRGLPYKEAYLTLIKASIYEIFEDIPDDCIKENITTAFDEHLLSHIKKEEVRA